MSKFRKQKLFKVIGMYLAGAAIIGGGMAYDAVYQPLPAAAAAFELNDSNKHCEITPAEKETEIVIDDALIQKIRGVGGNAAKLMFDNVTDTAPLNINVTGAMGDIKLILGSNNSYVNKINIADGKTAILNVSHTLNNAVISEIDMGKGAKLNGYTSGSTDKPITFIGKIVMAEGAEITELLICDSMTIEAPITSVQQAQAILSKVSVETETPEKIVLTVTNPKTNQTFNFDGAKKVK